jgi:hypothetical protein
MEQDEIVLEEGEVRNFLWRNRVCIVNVAVVRGFRHLHTLGKTR